MAVGMPGMNYSALDLAKNPLVETHEFKQACLQCFIKTGKMFFFFFAPCHGGSNTEFIV